MAYVRRMPVPDYQKYSLSKREREMDAILFMVLYFSRLNCFTPHGTCMVPYCTGYWNPWKENLIERTVWLNFFEKRWCICFSEYGTVPCYNTSQLEKRRRFQKKEHFAIFFRMYFFSIKILRYSMNLLW